MKKKAGSLFFFITVVIVRALGQSADVTEGCVPLEVKFEAPAGSSGYYWDFQDGVTSDQQNPTNIFSQPGEFNVTFREAPGGGVVGTVAITVYEEPALDIEVSPFPGCVPLNAEFTNLSQIHSDIEILDYVWVFGDGQRSEGTENPTHLYSALGIYDISFSIETEFETCNKTVIFDDAVEVISRPVASFFTNPVIPVSCEDSLVVEFTDNSSGGRPLSYSWDLGNGTVSDLPAPPEQEYESGQFAAKLTVSYTGIPGCTSTATRNISVGSPVPEIIIENDSICLGDTAKVSTTTPGIYSWEFGSSADPGTSAAKSVEVIFDQPGVHTITLEVTSSGGQCSGISTTEIYVEELTAKIEADPGYICESPDKIIYTAISNQADVSYSWTFIPEIENDPDFTSEVVEKTFASDTDSLYFGKNIFEPVLATLLVTSNKTGCSALTFSIDTLWLPNARFMPMVTKGCAPLQIVFSDSSTSAAMDEIVSWEWVFDDGTSLIRSDSLSVLHIYEDPGEYLAELVVTTEKGCIDTSYAILIEVGEDLSSQVDFTTDKTEVCPGEEVKFSTVTSSTVVDAYHFTSEGNRTFHCSDEDTLAWEYNHESGPQDVSLTVDYNGCFTTVTKPDFIQVKGAIAKIDYTAFCEDPLNYTFTSLSQNATSLSWDFGDGEVSAEDTAEHTYSSSGTYQVTLTAQNGDGCAATTDALEVNPKVIKASIELTDTLLCVNKAYTFTASGSQDVYADCYTGYTWQFLTMDKRPYTSASSSASFAFTPQQLAGEKEHMVRLIAKDINGCKDTVTASFQVYDMVLSAAVSDNSICVPGDVQFTDASAGDTLLHKWEWSFGDGNTSEEVDPLHSYTTPPSAGSSYQVQLRVTDTLGCSETLNVPVGYYKPSSTITLSKSNLCLGDSVTISASDFTQQGSNLEFLWDFGNGDTGEDATNKILYQTAQDYTVKLIYEEAGSGCKDSTTALVRVQEYPVAGISTNVDSVVVLCAPQNVFFEDASQSGSTITYNYWNFGNGQASTATEFSLFYDKGTYEAIHIVRTSFGCADTASRTFNVYRPEGDFDMDKNTICKGDEILFTIKDTADITSFTWAFGDGMVLNHQAPVSHPYNFHPESGQTIAKLILRGFDGACPVELEQPVYIHQVIADFVREDGLDTSICFNDGPYHFTNTSVSYDSHLWDFGDGQISSEVSPVHSYAESGAYDVTLSVSNILTGCVDTIVKKAVIYDNPVVTTVGDTVCQGDTLQLYVVNPVPSSIYSWTPSQDLSDDAVPDPRAFPLSTKQYQVTETDTNACTGTAGISAVVIEPIDLYDWDTTIVIGDEIYLPVARPDLYIFNWTPEEGLGCLNCSYPKVRPLEDITYNLQVTDSLNCFSSPFQYNIIVRPETFVKLPTSFTPGNEDQVNNLFLIRGWGIKELLEFQIFNRWGQLIYSSADINQGWDGTFKGVAQNSDVYVYKVKVLTWRDEVLFEEGYVNLLR